MTGAYVIVLKHPDHPTSDLGFLVFGTEFDSQLRIYSRSICCFRKFWRYDDMMEYLHSKLKNSRTPEEINAAGGFMSVDDIHPCWLIVKPNVKFDSPLHKEYIRMKKLVLKMKDTDGALAVAETHQLTSMQMVGFNLISASTMFESIAWSADVCRR
jgi:hypothetical protein